MPIISQLQAKFKKYFVPQILATIPSRFNGRIIVKDGFGSRYIHTDVAEVTQSGGIVNKLWLPVFKKIKPSPGKSWLVLGLAGGTVVRQISQKFTPSRLVGVEIDPVMIDIGKKYFDLDKIPNLEIIQLDAKRYTLNAKDHFDYILVDLYIGDKIPAFTSQPEFLDQLEQLGQLVIFNRLFYNSANKTSAQEFVKLVGNHFSKTELVRSFANLMIICE
ncbi:MAG: spermidine synthase [Microgenomates group bacterium Gr01-1014_16]|nr:MAG: spermidine synthase [Microgenomates group bacterium Gr01-1014_16]